MRADSGDVKIASEDLFAYVMVFHADVFGTQMPDMVLCEFGCSVVVTVQWGSAGR